MACRCSRPASYKPRLADDRVGHFLSVIKDFSRDVHETPNVHYVTRWNLEKEQPAAEKSPPKQPIIFWIERTVPREYRQYVREGILEWNKAFEKVGFIDAIQVRDQQSDDEFDPEDIRYNTFRWITTSAGFAMGPSRTNPKTGEILDADIIFDEGMIRYWRQEYIERAGIPDGDGDAFGRSAAGFFKLFAADLPSFADAEPLLDRMLNENRDDVRSARCTPRRARRISSHSARRLVRGARWGRGCSVNSRSWRPFWQPRGSSIPAAKSRRSSSARPSRKS